MPGNMGEAGTSNATTTSTFPENGNRKLSFVRNLFKTPSSVHINLYIWRITSYVLIFVRVTERSLTSDCKSDDTIKLLFNILLEHFL